MLRVVFDTVVLVRSLINPYGLWGKLVFEHFARYQLIVSPDILREYLDVLSRPELTTRFRRIQGLDRQRVLDLVQQAVVVNPANTPAISRDRKDDPFLAAAVAGGAACLVSEDRDLLVLREHQGIGIVDGRAFLTMLEG